MTLNWSNQGTSMRMDVVCLIFALAIHAPLIWVKIDVKKKSIDRKLERLVSVDMLDNLPVKPVAPKKVAPKKAK